MVKRRMVFSSNVEGTAMSPAALVTGPPARASELGGAVLLGSWPTEADGRIPKAASLAGAYPVSPQPSAPRRTVLPAMDRYDESAMPVNELNVL